jgi:copper chaperone CopZ
MAKSTFDVPTLWADHHVLKVREALLGLDGVDDVYASSAWKQVLVTYNSKKTKKAEIEKALAKAGYPVGDGEVPIVVQPTAIRRDPQWADGVRTTQTNQADLEMSGEFRRY